VQIMINTVAVASFPQRQAVTHQMHHTTHTKRQWLLTGCGLPASKCRLRLKCDGARTKSDLDFLRNGRVHLIQRAEVSSVDYRQPRCAHAAVVMLDKTWSEVVRWVLATHSICQFNFLSPTVRHRVPSHFNWTLPAVWMWRPTKHKSLPSVRTAYHNNNQPNKQNTSHCGQFAQLIVTTTSQTNKRTAVLQMLSKYYLKYIELTRSPTVPTETHQSTSLTSSSKM
jgi:hypothetical protein